MLQQVYSSLRGRLLASPDSIVIWPNDLWPIEDTYFRFLPIDLL